MTTRSVPDGDLGWGPDLRQVIQRKNELTDDVTGRVPPAQLGSGSPSSANFLRGDGSWVAAPGGVQASVLTAKGDLFIATASGVVTRQPIGTDGQTPFADSTQTTGWRWGSNVPADGSVTDVKVPSGAAISADKVADGTTNKLLTATERIKLSAIGVVRGVTPASGVIDINANTAGNSIDSTLTVDTTLNVPTNGTSGQVLQGTVVASGAQRILTFNASFGRLTGITATLTIPTGKVGRYSLRRTDITGSAKWLVEATGVEQ